jgi:hypothetical protein
MTRIQAVESIGRGRRALFVLLVAALLAVSLSGVALAKPGKGTSGVIYASANHTEGSDLYVSGDFNDTLLGRGAIVYVVQASSGPEPNSVLVKADKITVFTTRGSLTGTGQAIQTFNPDGSSTVSGGTFKLKKGTGDYKGHKLTGTFDGTFINGVYTFNYVGTYK